MQLLVGLMVCLLVSRWEYKKDNWLVHLLDNLKVVLLAYSLVVSLGNRSVERMAILLELQLESVQVVLKVYLMEKRLVSEMVY